MGRGAATAIGFTAVLMWSLLALFTVASGQVPPFQLLAMCFAIAGSLGLGRMLVSPAARGALRQPLAVWLLGVGGLFGYHFFYFTALRNAPAVDASLIAYLWPLLIVVCSALLPGERLGWHHVLGALLGLAGAVLIVTRGESLALDPAYTVGYLSALGAAGTWTAYSLLTRRFPSVPTDTVTGFCLVTAVLALGAHLALEETVWPASFIEWLAVLGLGLGPVGLSFYSWDYGCKQGDIQVLGASAYAAPLLSTLILIAAGYAEASWPVALAALLVSGGGVLAARDLLLRARWAAGGR